MVSLDALGLSGWYAHTHLTNRERGESDKGTTGNGSGAERPGDLPESSQELTDADQYTLNTNTTNLRRLVEKYDAAEVLRQRREKLTARQLLTGKIADIILADQAFHQADKELFSYITNNIEKGDDASQQLAWAPLSEAVGHSPIMRQRLFNSDT